MKLGRRLLRCAVAAGLVAGIAGCNGIGINAAISECGGFKSTSSALVVDAVEVADTADVAEAADVLEVVDDYGCGPGRLLLSVDEEKGVVHFLWTSRSTISTRYS